MCFCWGVRTVQNFREGANLTANDAIRQASTFHGLSEIAAQLSPVSSPDIGELAFIQPKGICLIEAPGFKVQCLETLTGRRYTLNAHRDPTSGQGLYPSSLPISRSFTVVFIAVVCVSLHAGAGFPLFLPTNLPAFRHWFFYLLFLLSSAHSMTCMNWSIP